MKKRFLHILFLFLLFSNGVFAQLNLGGEEKYKALTETMKRLDDALIAKNSFELDKILSDELKMTHSNGMVETKQDLIDHINKGYLEYKSIKQLKL